VKNIWILSRMTFREALRRRIVLMGLVLGVLFLIVYSVGFHMIYGSMSQEGVQAGAAMARIAEREGTNLLLLMGLYAITFLAVALGALLGADTLAGEISSGTVQTLVSKPIRRSDVVFGKWLGFSGMLGLYILLMSGGTVLSVFLQAGYVAPNLLLGVSLIFMEAVLMMTVSLACSSAMSGLATGAVVFGLYGLAFIGGWIEQFGSLLESQTAVKVGIVTSLLVPSEALWRRASFEMQTPFAVALGMSPFGTVSVPSGLMVGYAGLYLILALAAAVSIFGRRDL
jgi:ABC-type transport system involved in multi-copper enzyme maturation permease subunit